MEIPEDVMEAGRKAVADFPFDSIDPFKTKARVVARAILAERERCIGHVYGQAGGDNVAQRTVEAIRSGTCA